MTNVASHAARRDEVVQPPDQIFLIDEDDVVRDSLKVLLESHGMQVQDFRSTAEFLAKPGVSRGGCLVLGHNRSITDGLTLMQALQRRSAELPVIFIVGSGNCTIKAAAIAAGAFAYLERPIEEAALIRTIKAGLARKTLRSLPLNETAPADQPIGIVRR
jgi:two-component system, LuxR family, response regulator FixJ